jgi:ribose/xylose/arabinose/galactoside ABC-type transport system permease subunit
MAREENTTRKASFKVSQSMKRLIRHENAVLVIILAALAAGFGIMSKGYALSPSNMTNVLVQSAARGVAAVGQTFVILSGGIDISVGGIALVTLNAAGLMITGTTGLPMGPIAIMMLIGIGLGAFNGFAVSRMQLPPLIITLAFWGILKGVALIMTGGATIVRFPKEIALFGQGRIAGMSVAVIIFIVSAAVAYFVLHHTAYGRSVYAVGGNPVSAWLSGLKTSNVLFLVYVISGFTGALAGLITMSRTMSASQVAVSNLELDAIASVVIGGVSLAGGRGNIIGAVIGVIIIGVVNNGMNILELPPAYHDVVKGAIIWVAVAVDALRRRR